MTWELWYGRLVQDEIASTHKGDVEKAMREGVRPSMAVIHEPPQKLCELIGGMWSHDPKSRPHADAILEAILEIRW